MSEGIPPLAPRSSGGCWKWGGIACLGLGCFGIIAVGVLVAIFASRPEFKNVVKHTTQAGLAVQRLQTLGQALRKYAHDHGQYPDELADLVPKYAKAEELRISPEPDSPVFHYQKPPADASNDFQLLTYDMKNPVMPDRAPGIRYFLTKGGDLGTINIIKETGNTRQDKQPGSPSGGGIIVR